MPDFRPLPLHRLGRLGDEETLDYVVAARGVGDTHAEREAVSYLAFAFEPTARAWVRGKTPAEDVDDVVMEVLESAIKQSFEGKVLGEFGSLLKTIAKRRVVDNLRRRRRRFDAVPLASEHEGEEGIWGCDAYDAMTTDRPYRASIGEAEARAELRRGAGSQFDPDVVTALLAVLVDSAPQLEPAPAGRE